MTRSPNVILIGMPGAGKSTVGVLLAKRLQYNFLDTDILIQSREGRNLQTIIRSDGLEGFRNIEENYVCSVSEPATVIATGGSVVYSPRAMEHLASIGVVIFLSLGLHQLAARLSDIDARGVLRMPGQTLADIYRERSPLYARYADMTIPTESQTPDQVMKTIVSRLREDGHLS